MSSYPTLITTPIYYVNGMPHIGHAYTSIVADVFARFRRLLSEPVLMITGTDEHGTKVKQSALKAGLMPKEFADSISQQFRTFSDGLSMQYDKFMRTTSDEHKRSVLEMWRRAVDNGDIYLGKYSGWYSVRDEAFYKEEDLVEGKAPTGADVQWVEEESYFFRLSKYQDFLLDFYSMAKKFVSPKAKLNELIAFVSAGLDDISVSRVTCDWGIPVPDNPKHTLYVWFDALSIYLTACDFPDEAKWRNFKRVHILGKDILRFHGVFWPAFLHSAGLPLPDKMIVHGWWTNNKEKMSKSLGNVVSPSDTIRKYGLDSMRYFLLREIKLGNDGDFSEEALVKTVNLDLVNNIGNLLRRVMTLVIKHFKQIGLTGSSLNSELDLYVAKSFDLYLGKMWDFEIQEALEAIISIADYTNEFVNRVKLWQLEGESSRNALATAVFALRVVSLMLQPMLPSSSAAMLDILQIPEGKRGLTDKALAHCKDFPNAFPIDELPMIFPRLRIAEDA